MIKALFAVLLSVTMFACSNPKEEIVDRQKEITVEMRRIDDSLHGQYGQSVRSDLINKKISLEEIGNSSYSRMNVRYGHLKKEYDSLEMELKKY